jgi:hypothetical protein
VSEPTRDEWALGREAYVTFTAVTNILSGNIGKPVPDWRGLPRTAQEAWYAAAKVVRVAVEAGSPVPDVTGDGTDRGDPIPLEIWA